MPSNSGERRYVPATSFVGRISPFLQLPSTSATSLQLRCACCVKTDTREQNMF